MAEPHAVSSTIARMLTGQGSKKLSAFLEAFEIALWRLAYGSPPRRRKKR